MPRKRRDTPEQATAKAAARRTEERRAAFESVGMAPVAADLPQNQNVRIEPMQRQDAKAGQRGNAKRARRDDVFEALLRIHDAGQEDGDRRKASLNAARRLENDFSIQAGEGDRRPMERIDGRAQGGRVDVMLAAGERVATVLRLVGPRNAALLRALIRPTKGPDTEPERWREVVHVVTGERNIVAQAAVVRSACHNLAYAYLEIDRAPRRIAA